MNIIKLIGQRAMCANYIETELSDIRLKYIQDKFNIYFHGNYKGGYISIFKDAKNTERTICKIKDEDSNYVVEIEIDKEIEKLYPTTLNTVLKKITGKEFNELKNNNF